MGSDSRYQDKLSYYLRKRDKSGRNFVDLIYRAIDNKLLPFMLANSFSIIRIPTCVPVAFINEWAVKQFDNPDEATAIVTRDKVAENSKCSHIRVKGESYSVYVSLELNKAAIDDLRSKASKLDEYNSKKSPKKTVTFGCQRVEEGAIKSINFKPGKSRAEMMREQLRKIRSKHGAIAAIGR